MHLMICHRCVLVFTEFLDFLKQIIILIWDFLLFIIFNNFSLLGHDCQVPQCQSFTPPPLTPPKESKVKYLNFAKLRQLFIFFAEILHTGRAAIDIKH